MHAIAKGKCLLECNVSVKTGGSEVDSRVFMEELHLHPCKICACCFKAVKSAGHISINYFHPKENCNVALDPAKYISWKCCSEQALADSLFMLIMLCKKQCWQFLLAFLVWTRLAKLLNDCWTEHSLPFLEYTHFLLLCRI